MKIAILIIALLLMPASAFIMKLNWLGMVFIVFYVIFGIIEAVSKMKTGKTVSQQVQAAPLWKRIIVISFMILGWGALILHFLKVL